MSFSKFELLLEISLILKSSAISATGLISCPSDGAQPKRATKFIKASVKYPCFTKSETAVAPWRFDNLLQVLHRLKFALVYLKYGLHPL